MVRLSARSTLLVLLFVLLGSFASAGEAAVLQVLVGDPVDEEIEEVLYIAVGVELNRHGLTSRRPANRRRSGAQDDAQVRRLAEQSDAGYVLVTEYRSTGSQIAGTMRLFASDASLLSQRPFDLPITIDLDRDLAAAVASFLGEIEIRQERDERTSVEGVSVVPRTAELQDPQTVRQFVFASDPFEGFHFDALGGGLLVGGNARKFFRYGYGGGIVAGFVPSARSVSVSYGLKSLAFAIVKEDEITGGNLLLITAAPGIELSTSIREPSRFFVRIGGGPAFFVLDDELGARAKTEIVAEGGVGALLALGERFGLGIELSYLHVFDQDLPVSGFVPSIRIGMEP